MSTPATSLPQTTRLLWPPPGLERVQGQIWPVIGGLGIGGAIMVTPLLVAVVADQPFWSVGVGSTGMWLTLAAAIVDFLVLIESYLHLSAVIREAAQGARHGYGWKLIARVAADHTRDTGRLLAGAREFSTLSEAQRRAILNARVIGVFGYLSGVVWLPLVFPICVVLASLSVISATAVWVLALAPAALFLLIGVVARALENHWLKPVRRVQAEALEVERDVHEWIAENELNAGLPRPRMYRGLGAMILAASLLLFVPLFFALSGAFTGVVLSVTTRINYPRAQRNLAEAEVFRGYRLPASPGVSALAAGEAFHRIYMAGEGARDPLLRAPTRQYPGLPLELATIQIPGWIDSIFSRFGEQPEAYQSQIRAIAAYPATAELQLLGRAASVDLLAAMFNLPLPDTLQAVQLPIVKFNRLRELSAAQFARAALAAREGRTQEAERMIKEVIGAGFLLIDFGHYLIEPLIGASVIQRSGDALAALYSATGQTTQLEVLRSQRAAARRAAAVAQAGLGSTANADFLETVPRLVLDRNVTAGFRWELFMTFNMVAPCLNLHNVLFGLGSDYDDWLEQARGALVRHPADAELFAIGRHGSLGTKKKMTNLCGLVGAWRVLREGP